MNPPTSHPAAPHLRLVPQPEPEPGVVESYRRLADVFHDVLSEQSLDALLDRIADTLRELVPYDDLHIYEANEGARTLKAVFVRGDWESEVLADEPIRYGEGITGWAAQHREPVLANQAHLDPRVRFVANTPIEPESLVAVPLIARGLLKGTLNIYRVGEHAAFAEEEFQLASRFGDAAALALDNAHIRASLELQAQTDPLTGLFNHRAFHEHLRKELLAASASHGTVGLVMLDLDDFKRVNDVYGHATGDGVLADVADVLRASVRGGDAVCRIGGEEFAIVVPGGNLEAARHLAGRLLEQLRERDFPPGRMSVSVGLAVGPLHAANPRELVACAEAAMMTAKARGKNRVVVFDDEANERPAHVERREDVRSIAHLKMLQSVSAKLSRLNETAEIAATIADELRRLIDYHNCRVFVVEGDSLRPIAFRGELTNPDGGKLESLAMKVGVGVTGRVAETGEPLLLGDATKCEFAHHIEGTAEIEESLLVVPLHYGTRVVGVIVVSKLGLDQFDADDLRLLEVIAGHASAALVNAQLLETQRREAEAAKALLEVSRALASVTELDEVLSRVADETARVLGSDHTSVWLPEEGGEVIRCHAYSSTDAERRAVVLGAELPLSRFPFEDLRTPFVVAPQDYACLAEVSPIPLREDVYAVAPLVVDGRLGFITVAADGQRRFDERELELLDGIANQAKLAITTALSFASLERTFLATVEALANAMEAKDEYTSSHARWITDMALRVGHELGLDQPALKRLELAALFHDIGKIGIPASVLFKPGPLTDEERTLIESHPELGERILAPIEQLAEVRPIVRACHERFDGRGYPDRLAGEEIPLEARIIFACDAFHAMTTERPYRNPLPAEEARRRLGEAAGTQFDPAVVEICLRILEPPLA